jgi:6-pyruvoyltetrahydropterin/6-carboxytetrahydropterin synthase
VEISYRFGFDAAHRFDAFPAGHSYSNIHGHSFQVEVALAGDPDEASGFVADFGHVERECRRVREALDHRLLNEIAGLGTPSLENISVWIWNFLSPTFANLSRVTVRRDSCGQSCSYTDRK